MIFGMLLFINAMFGMSTDIPVQEVSFLSVKITDTTFMTVGYANYYDYEKVWIRVSVR